MAHLDIYLDKCPGFSWEGAPEFRTTIVTLKNKRTRRNANWSQPRWRFTVPFNSNFPEHYQQVLDVFSICRGRLNAFRVRNWLFYQARGWKFGTGDGITSEFQLGRLVELGGESFLQEIHALSLQDDAIETVVYVDAAPAAAIFNLRTGRVYFDTPPVDGGILTWDGDFDYWVRFLSDDFPASIDNKSGGELITNFQADLEEVEAPDEDFST